MKKLVLVFLIGLLAKNVSICQNFLLKTNDYIDNPKGYFDNFVEIARQSTDHTAELILEKYGDNAEIEKIDNSPFKMLIFSHKSESRFPLVKATSIEENVTIFTSKMRVPPKIDIKKYLREMGFVFVTEQDKEDFYLTVFNAKGSINPLVELNYFDLVFQVMEFPYGEVYIQTSMYVEVKNQD